MWNPSTIEYPEEAWPDHWYTITGMSGWRIVIEIPDRILIAQNRATPLSKDFIFMWKED